MTSAEIIASIIGPFYIVVAIGLAVNPGVYRRLATDFIEQPALAYMGGIMALLMGLLILVFHNTWSADWTAIITLFGWLAALKGAVLIIRPRALVDLSQSIMQSDGMVRAMAFFALLLGLFLTGKGFAVF
ncbi:MAG: hypothetical protein HOK06_06910 [Rhodospirillaceae bacterium]|jgi:hypothetical protein|nr:hypothetical protein [Rhodospirillaceae bacterium]MBT4219381.1 hypothetical protein [Rhodospirillaceae bacterium]MBT4464293.1 hypothetical protein [Rhodospirillaceae bacterium]MBT5014077.1 hypothetical protein [Rhodospirillaceae bacterium]MBT5308706.1 hypothetical protein [Rhodospirillaceae bacterium]